MRELLRLVDVLVLADRESAGGATTIVFHDSRGGDPVGRLAAQGGRVCWASGSHQQPRVSDIFVEECGVSRDALEEAFAAASRNSTPFGEELVERKLVSEQDLRRCLRRQMTTALTSIATRWHGGGKGTGYTTEEVKDISYDPAFTVASLKLMLECTSGSDHLSRQAGEPVSGFRELASRLAGAVCLRRVPDEPIGFVPVSASNVNDMSLVGALELARSAMGVADPPALRAASVSPYAVLVHGNGRGFVCCHADPHLCIYEIEGRSQYGELLANLMAHARIRSEIREPV